MKGFKQQALTFTGLAGIYIGVIALLFKDQLTQLNLVATGVVYVIFVLSALITTSGSVADSEANTQRFILGTTVQMLLALFFLLIAKFTAHGNFKGMAIHFLVLFFVFLGTQAFFLIWRMRK